MTISHAMLSYSTKFISLFYVNTIAQSFYWVFCYSFYLKISAVTSKTIISLEGLTRYMTWSRASPTFPREVVSDF